jgi:hypothetical protein
LRRGKGQGAPSYRVVDTDYRHCGGFRQHSRWGTELSVEEANEAGGVLGRQIEVDFQDNRCNPTEAVAALPAASSLLARRSRNSPSASG